MSCPTWLTAGKKAMLHVVGWCKQIFGQWPLMWSGHGAEQHQVSMSFLTRKILLFSRKPLASTRCRRLHSPQDYHSTNLLWPGAPTFSHKTPVVSELKYMYCTWGEFCLSTNKCSTSVWACQSCRCYNYYIKTILKKARGNYAAKSFSTAT